MRKQISKIREGITGNEGRAYSRSSAGRKGAENKERGRGGKKER